MDHVADGEIDIRPCFRPSGRGKRAAAAPDVMRRMLGVRAMSIGTSSERD
jgi:hypothetical protein